MHPRPHLHDAAASGARERTEAVCAAHGRPAAVLGQRVEALRCRGGALRQQGDAVCNVKGSGQDSAVWKVDRDAQHPGTREPWILEDLCLTKVRTCGRQRTGFAVVLGLARLLLAR